MERAPQQRDILAHTNESSKPAWQTRPPEQQPSRFEGNDSNLTPLQQEWLNQYWDLAHFFALKLHDPKDGENELEEKRSLALFGLANALQGYDPYRPAMENEHSDENKRRTAYFSKTIKRAIWRKNREEMGTRIDTKQREPKPSVVRQSADSLDRTLRESDSIQLTLGDIIPDTSTEMPVEKEAVENTVEKVLDSRDESERDSKIFFLRTRRNMSQSEIAEEAGISQMHVSRVLRQIVDETLEELDYRAA